MLELVPECRNSPCGCDLADLIQLTQNIMEFLIYFGTVVLVLLLVYVGYLYVTNPTNPSNRSKARSIAMTGVIGFVIVLGGFLIVDTLINTFAKDEFGNWNNILRSERTECQMNVYEGTPGGNGGGGAVVGGGGSLTCANCVSVENASFDHKGPGSGCDLSKSQEEIDYCMINSSTFNALEEVQNSFSGAWRVNELWPPTVRHSNACHNQGTCVDAGPSDRSPASLARFINAARAAGLYPVWEDRAIQTEAQCESLVAEIEAAGGSGVAVQIGIPVSPHFSLYLGGSGSTGCL